MGKPLKIYTGQRFGMLTVVREVDRYNLPSGQKVRRFLFKCDCGNMHEAFLLHVVRGRITSCGCVGNIRGGESNTRIYKTWHTMMWRCNKHYFESQYYYDRGIRVSSEFLDYFYFKKWALENGYRDNLQMDRIDNSKGYSPENCHFVTSLINNANKRNTIIIEYNGVKTSLALLLHKKKLMGHYVTIRMRIARGWNAQRAVDHPIRQGNYKVKQLTMKGKI